MSTRADLKARHLLPDTPRARRYCPACDKWSDGSDEWGGPDPCIGRLPGVISACCGHGQHRPESYPYVWLLPDCRKLAGTRALDYMREQGGDPR